MTIIEPKHPFVMVGIIFLLCLTTGAIIGYMVTDIPGEVRDMFKPSPQISSEAVDSRDVVPDDVYYSTLYRPTIVLEYSRIPDDAVITNVTLYRGIP